MRSSRIVGFAFLADRRRTSGFGDALTAHAEHVGDQFMGHVNSMEDRRSRDSSCQRHNCWSTK
jgi:hypothetical protein